MSDFPESDPASAAAPQATQTLEPTASESAETMMPVLASWHDQDPVLRELWLSNQPPQVISERLGRSIPAIMTRAARLGLPRRSAPGRKPGVRTQDGESGRQQTVVRRATPPSQATTMAQQTSLRVCLMCLNKFESMGRHNRICSSCKGHRNMNRLVRCPNFMCRIRDV